MSRAPTPKPPAEGGSADATPGVSLRESPILGADIYLDATKSLTQLHQAALRGGLDEVVFDALRALPGSTQTEFQQVLYEIFRTDDRVGGGARDDESVSNVDRGRLSVPFEEMSNGEDADISSALSNALARAADALRNGNQESDAVTDARRALLRLGTGNVDNIPSERGDVFATTALLEDAGDAVPTRTIEVHLGVEWAGRRADQRAAVLEWLSDLWLVHDVEIVASRAAAARMVDKHRAILPAHLTRACKRQCTPAPTNSTERERGTDGRGAAGAVSERARLARDELSVAGRKTAVVAAVAAEETHSLTYEELAEALVLDSPSDGNLYQVVKRLEEDHGLVERIDQPNGYTAVSLTPAGLTFIQDLYETDGLQTSLPGFVAGVSQPPQIHSPMPCKPAQARRGGGGEADPDRPAAAEADAAEDADAVREEEWTHGLVAPTFMGYERATPLAAVSERGNIVLQNSRIQRDDVDPRVPRVSVGDGRLLVEPGKYENPLQFATTIAHGLAWEETRNRVLTPSDIDSLLDGELEIETLQDATGLGWLSEDDDGHDVAEGLDDALEALLFETGAWARDDHDVVGRIDSDEGFDESMLEGLDGFEPGDDRDLTPSEHRSLITRYSLGLSTTLVHLIDMTGVDVTLGVRVPECSRHFGDGDDENADRREALVKHLTTLSSQWSRYGAFNAFKQLIETRDRKRSNADPEVDAADPIGTMRAGIVVVGRGVEDLADELTKSLEDDRDLHEDAPEINVAVDVQEGAGIDADLETARRMLIDEKRMEPSPEAVSALTAFAADPWAIAEAVHWGISSEDMRREVHLDEVRRALSHLPWNRLVEEPDGSTSTKRKGVKTLLNAEEPISAAEMSRRGGPSTQSWRDHRDRLIELGLVEETPDGWRLTLPFRHERDATPTAVTDRDGDERPEIPWFWTDDSDIPGDLGREKRSPGDVIDWLLIERDLLEDTGRLHADHDDPVARWADAYYGGDDPAWSAMREICEEFEVPWRIIAAGCGLRQPSPTSHTASVGPELPQTALLDAPQSLSAD